jgi:cytosine/adenosine deaminase-related metal-dependent hydrolase
MQPDPKRGLRPALRALASVAVALLFAAACGGPLSVATAPPDAGIDGGADAGKDAGPAVDGGPLCAPDPPPAPRGTPSVTQGAASLWLLRGRVVTPDIVFDPGEVLVSGTTISCVGTCAGTPAAAGATVIDTAGVIYPGLVDAHNHTQYDYLPQWHPSPPALFQNRGQWPQRQDYKDFVRSVNANESLFKCEQVKYGEVVALLGGTTTMEGTYNSDLTCFRTLVHNAEHSELNPKARTNIGGVDGITSTAAASLRADLLSGKTTAYILHLGEGIDASSEAEFGKLVALGLLLPGTVIIHGTALTPADFAQMGAAGTKLVWSPQSNLVLYGATTNIPAALGAGVSVSLAPDWTLSGGPTLLQELKAARDYTCSTWPGLLDAAALVKMVTSVPADAMAVQAKVGRLAPGLLADLLVIRDRGQDPYRTLIEAQQADVRLVMIGGNLRYGDAALVEATGRYPCEALSVCGEDKRICVPDTALASNDKFNESLADLLAAVRGFQSSTQPLATCP